MEERRLVLFFFFYFFFFVFPCLYLLFVLSFPFPPLPPTGLLRGLHETRGHDARMCHGVILSISLVRVAVTRRRTRSRAPAAPARHPKQPRVSSQPGCLFKVNLHVYVYVHTTNTIESAGSLVLKCSSTFSRTNFSIRFFTCVLREGERTLIELGDFRRFGEKTGGSRKLSVFPD